MQKPIIAVSVMASTQNTKYHSELPASWYWMGAQHHVLCPGIGQLIVPGILRILIQACITTNPRVASKPSLPLPCFLPHTEFTGQRETALVILSPAIREAQKWLHVVIPRVALSDQNTRQAHK